VVEPAPADKIEVFRMVSPKFQSSTSRQQALDRAAEMWGVEPEFWDIWGKRHITSAGAKASILRAFGVDAGTRESLDAAMEQRMRGEWTRFLPPCVVVDASDSDAGLPVSVPAELLASVAHVTIRREDGEIESYAAPLREWKELERARFGGTEYVRVQAPLPAGLPLGYHQVELSFDGMRHSTRLIAAPDCAYMPDFLSGNGRGAGVAVALYGLRSERNWGCGDLGDLRRVIDWAADEAKAGFIALNPLHALHNRRPFNTSPYLPTSVFYHNLIYLDVEAVPDFKASSRAQKRWAKPEAGAELEALRRAEFVEYERVHAIKLCFLKLAFVHFLQELRAGSERARAFQQYVAGEGELLERFALYCALDEYIHARNPEIWVWPDWPDPYRHPQSEQSRAFREKHRRSVMFYQYVQWQLHLQLSAVKDYASSRGLPIGLYHDLALATDRCGSDLWGHRQHFISGCRVGSPPDDFSPKGQDWAFPPPNTGAHRENGYELFIESIRKNSRYGGALRIDHVMRFFRLYWIPEGLDATQGAYVRDRYEDLLRILALESVRNKVVVVGEDLGTVEPSVRDILTRFGILSYRLLYFEKERDGSFKKSQDYPKQALVSSTTHDLPTVAGFWTNADIEARRAAGALPDDASYRQQIAERAREKQKMLDVLFALSLLPDYFPRSAADVPELTGELHNAVIGFLASTPSKLMVLNQEDLTKETAQQNLPATTWQYPNWSRKMKYTVEELRTHQTARDFTAMFRHWLERTGRAISG
jgi:4-alpha-glucanotransferase